MTSTKLLALIGQAETANKSDSFAEAVTLAQCALDDAGIATQTELRVRALLVLAFALRRQGKVRESLAFADEVLRLCKDADDSLSREWEVRALQHLGLGFMRLGQVTEALENFERALNLATELDLKEECANLTANLGLVHNHRGDYVMAMESMKQALLMHEQLGMKKESANMTANIGSMYFQLSDFPKAMEFMSRAMTIYEQLRDKVGIAMLTGNLGMVYRSLSDNNKALELLELSVALHSELGMETEAATYTMNIGNTYYNLEQYPSALEYLGRALGVFEKLGAQSEAATAIGSIANTYHNMGDYTSALEYVHRALALYESLGMKSYVAHFTHSIGSMHTKSESPHYHTQKAEEYFRTSLSMYEEIGIKQGLLSNRFSLAELTEKQGRWEESLQHLRSYQALYVAVQSEEATRQAQQLENRRRIDEAERDRQVKLARFREQERILHNILPTSIANRMVSGEKTIAELFNDVSIFFSDIVNFTQLTAKVHPEELVQTLNTIFSEFDRLARKHGLEKIKTIGDSYMAVCGVPVPNERHAECVVLFALDVHSFIEKFTMSTGEPLTIRIGLHCGSVVAGIIGENKFAYDLWGDAVNTAARMESHGEPGKIHISNAFASHLQQHIESSAVETQSIASLPSGIASLPSGIASLRFVERDEIEIKGKGMMRTYFLEKV